MTIADEYASFTKQEGNYTPLSPLSFIQRTANYFPNHTAIIDGDKHYSYAEVFERCRRLASGLQKLGISKGDTVAVIAYNSPEMIECHHGVAATGGVLNTINVRLDPETIAYILEHGEARVLITDTDFAPAVKKALARLNPNHHITVIDIDNPVTKGEKNYLGEMTYDDLLATGDSDFVWKLPDDEWDALALNYTSGSTGKPKGVVYHHRGSHLMTIGTIADWQMPRYLRYYYSVPLFHCNGWGHVWAVASLAGAIVATRKITAKSIYDAIADNGVTHFGGAPIILGMILNAEASEKRPIDHQVEIITAGAPPPAAILKGIEAIGFNVNQVYGLTETFGHAVICVWQDEWDENIDPDERAKIKARQGIPMTMTEDMVILDSESGRPLPRDGKSIGEIGMRGNTIMKGYLKNPEATEAAFKNGYFLSGDLAVMHPNGYVEIKDRLKDIIISGGENISSVEIESVLHQHPSIAIAAVVAKADPKWGEVPCAFIELKNGLTATEDDIINFCRDNIAGFKIPKKIVFMTIPKTATGKLQKFELRRLLDEGKV